MAYDPEKQREWARLRQAKDWERRKRSMRPFRPNPRQGARVCQPTYGESIHSGGSIRATRMGA